MQKSATLNLRVDPEVKQSAESVLSQLGLSQTPRTALVSDPARGIYCVGDCASGASLVVRALASGKNLRGVEASVAFSRMREELIGA